MAHQRGHGQARNRVQGDQQQAEGEQSVYRAQETAQRERRVGRRGVGFAHSDRLSRGREFLHPREQLGGGRGVGEGTPAEPCSPAAAHGADRPRSVRAGGHATVGDRPWTGRGRIDNHDRLVGA